MYTYDRRTKIAAGDTLTTYMKLRDGSWGLRCLGYYPTPGAMVRVTKKDGTSKSEVVGSVLWKGKDRDTGLPLAFASIVVSRPKSSPSTGEGQCAECGSKRGPFVEKPDASNIWAPVCRSCARLERFDRSYM